MGGYDLRSARKLGISVAEYVEHRAASRVYCPGCRAWLPGEAVSRGQSRCRACMALYRGKQPKTPCRCCGVLIHQKGGGGYCRAARCRTASRKRRSRDDGAWWAAYAKAKTAVGLGVGQQGTPLPEAEMERRLCNYEAKAELGLDLFECEGRGG